MLPKRRRLARADFPALLRGGEVRNLLHFSIRRRRSAGGLRAAVVVSKKVVPTAVGRNRLRRRVYHALRSFQEASWGDIVLFARKGAEKLSVRQIEEELRALERSK